MRIRLQSCGWLILVMAIILTAPQATAQMARVSGTVVDPEGHPIADATLTVTTPDSNSFELVSTSNKKGKAVFSFANAEWRYRVRIEKAGYRPLIETLQLAVGGTVRAVWTLVPDQQGSGGAASGTPVEGSGGNQALRTFNEGVEAQRVGDLDLAEQRYRAALELDPNFTAAHSALSAVALLREDWATAASEAEAALALDPQDARAMQLRFEAYRHSGDEEKMQEAAAALREAGGIDQAATRVYNEGVDAFSSGDLTAAISKFQQVVELDPQMADAYVALAQIYLTRGSPAKAAGAAKQALELDPDDDRALKLGFDAARMTGDSESAAADLERLVDVDPEWLGTVLMDHAHKLFNADQPEQAAFELEYVVKAHPDLARAHFLLGMSLYNTGRVDEGRNHLETFIKLAPDDPDVEIARGVLNYSK